MDLATLHPYARRFTEALLRRFPSWGTYVQVGCEDHGPNNALVKVPSPADPTLFICVDDEDAEIFWDRWHFHAEDAESDDTWRADWPETFRTLEDVLAERIVIAVAMQGDDWKCSSDLPADDEDGSLDFITDPHLRGVDRCYALSWTGRKNRTWLHGGP